MSDNCTTPLDKPSGGRDELVWLAVLVVGTFAYLWFMASSARWTVLFLISPVLLLWRGQSYNTASLGLAPRCFLLSFIRWKYLWIGVAALFTVLEWRTLLESRLIFKGFIYFFWCALQQLVYQSAVYPVLRRHLRRRSLAVASAGVLFAVVHAPNPVLIAGVFVWGAVSALLFDRCRSILGLALMQVLLSSILLNSTPYNVNHGFRVGPFYYSVPKQAPAEVR